MPDRSEKFAEEPRSSERRAGRVSRARRRKGIPTRARVEVRRQSIIRVAALAGTVGPIVFGGTLLALSVLEYDFMVGIGWHPVADPSGAWPSGLALGPYEAAQAVNFVVSGPLLAFFAQGHPFSLADGDGLRYLPILSTKHPAIPGNRIR
jgi:hypothetical protein